MNLTKNILEETRQAFASVRSSYIEAMKLLWQVKETEAWKEAGYESFGEFVEQDLGISQSMASKLGTVHKTYLLEGGLSQDKLQDVDVEKLYLATKLSGDAEERLAKARTLTRGEMKLEKNDEAPTKAISGLIARSAGYLKRIMYER